MNTYKDDAKRENSKNRRRTVSNCQIVYSKVPVLFANELKLAITTFYDDDAMMYYDDDTVLVSKVSNR